jgi:Flp pilus assembly protein TadB
MIQMALLGAALGAVLYGLIVVVAPPRHNAVVQLGQFDAHNRGQAEQRPQDAPPTAAQGIELRIGGWVAAQLAQRGIRYRSLQQDLALTRQTFDALMGRKVVAAGGGFLVALLGFGFAQYGAGVSLPPGAPVMAAVLVGAALFVAPDIDVRKEAARRRREFTEHLAIYLELVALEMAGYAAAEAALPQAARYGGTWSMLLIRDTLLRARLSGEDRWDALTALGERIGVADLRDLGSLVKTVADDGAQVRQTLSARAASMRRALLAEDDIEAKRRKQMMGLAGLLIAAGFMLFVGYPAFVNISL